MSELSCRILGIENDGDTSDLNAAIRTKDLEIIKYILSKGVRTTDMSMTYAYGTMDEKIVDFIREKID